MYSDSLHTPIVDTLVVCEVEFNRLNMSSCDTVCLSTSHTTSVSIGVCRESEPIVDTLVVSECRESEPIVDTLVVSEVCAIEFEVDRPTVVA